MLNSNPWYQNLCPKAKKNAVVKALKQIQIKLISNLQNFTGKIVVNKYTAQFETIESLTNNLI